MTKETSKASAPPTGNCRKTQSKRTQHVTKTLNVIGWLNYNFECDWLIELSDNKLSNDKLSNNKLSDNNLTNRFKPITIKVILIFMNIMTITSIGLMNYSLSR